MSYASCFFTRFLYACLVHFIDIQLWLKFFFGINLWIRKMIFEILAEGKQQGRELVISPHVVAVWLLTLKLMLLQHLPFDYCYLLHNHIMYKNVVKGSDGGL